MPQKLTELREPVNILYYGDGGTGKTTSLMAMANLGRLIVVNAESGVKARALRQQGINVENIEVFPGKDETLTFDTLEALWLQIREELHADPDAVVGIVWDSITEIHKLLLDSIVGVAVERSRRKGVDRDKHFIALEDYGVMTEQVRGLVRKFRDLPCHFGVSALARRDQDDDGKVIYQPAVTPKIAIDLIGWMDVVCHTTVGTIEGDEEYRGLFRPEGKFRGKDRLGALPRKLVDPKFDRVLMYVEGDLDLDTDPVMQQALERRQQQGEKAVEAELAGAVPAGSGS